MNRMMRCAALSALPTALAVGLRARHQQLAELGVKDVAYDKATLSLSSSASSGTALTDSIMAMLRQSEGNTPALEMFVSQIKNMLENEMKPHILATRESEQARLYKALEAFGAVSQSRQRKEEKTAYGIEIAKQGGPEVVACRRAESSAQAAYTACATQEAVLKEQSKLACSQAEAFKAAEPAACVVREGGESFGAYTKRLEEFFGTNLKNFQSKKAECDSTKASLVLRSGECKALKQKYDLRATQCNNLDSDMTRSICAWARSGVRACTTFGTSYEQALANFKNVTRDVKKQERGMIGEYEGILKIECIAGIFARDDDQKSAGIKACQEKDLETEAKRRVSIKYPDVPDKGSCKYVKLPPECPLAGEEAFGDEDYKPPPAVGMVAWFKSEDVSTSWKSSVGSFKLQNSGSAASVRKASGNGAANQIGFLAGDTNTQLDFGPVLQHTFTLCTVSRYTGGAQNRIFQGSAGNFLHGHWNNQVCVAHYDGWQTSPYMDAGDTNWAIMCATNTRPIAICNGRAVGTGATHTGGNRNLMVNAGGCCGRSEASNFAVAEVIAWNRALTETEMRQAHDYLFGKLGQYQTSVTKAQLAQIPAGLVSWFRSEDASASEWPSAVGRHVAKVSSGTIRVKKEVGNGAGNPVRFLQGDTSTRYNFGGVLRPQFTICSVTRYTGGSNGRILQGSHGNFLHSHWNNQVCVAHYDGWVTTPYQDTQDLNWAVMCGTNMAPVLICNGRAVGTGATRAGGGRSLMINQGDAGGGEVSNFAVMEVITWDRALDEKEMWAMHDYLTKKLGTYSTSATSAQIGAMPPGLIAWYRSEDAASDSWPSSVGRYAATRTGGSVAVKQEAGNGAFKPLRFISGDTAATFNFGGILRPKFTLCSLSRYTGGARGRILQGSLGNMLHGHWANQVGVAYYEGWETTPYRNGGVTNWVVICGTNSAPIVIGEEGDNIGTGASNNGGGRGLTINEGGVGGEKSDWAVAEVIAWDRPLSIQEMTQAHANLMEKLGSPRQLTSVTAEELAAMPSGLVSWFRSEDASPSGWPSAVGRFLGKPSGSPLVEVSEAGNGASNAVIHLTGSTSSQFDFGNILKPTWTMCAVTRYTGGTMGRILQGSAGNLLHGHWNRQVCVAHYDGWQTAPYMDAADTNWAVICGTNAAPLVLCNGRNVATGNTNAGGSRSVTINQGGCCGGERSDFGVMEVITWNRALSSQEMWKMHDYLTAKLGSPSTGVSASQVSVLPKGLVAWYRSEDADGKAWPSSVGRYTAKLVSGFASVRTEAGNGASNAVQFLRGDSSARFDFGAVVRPVFTMCSAARYTGGSRGRILQGSSGNMLHGHWNNQVGVVYYDGWKTTPYRDAGNTNWAIVCTSNQGGEVYYNARNVGNGARGAGGGRCLWVNQGADGGGEHSDWAIAEVITWDRTLSSSELKTAYNYLASKLGQQLV